jgi:hypothetical protein
VVEEPRPAAVQRITAVRAGPGAMTGPTT